MSHQVPMRPRPSPRGPFRGPSRDSPSRDSSAACAGRDWGAQYYGVF
jgi:hypothetical protein